MSKHKGVQQVKSGLKVMVRDGKVDQAVRYLKRLVQQEGLLADIRSHEFYEKPSVKARRRHEAAVKRERKRLRDDRNR